MGLELDPIVNQRFKANDLRGCDYRTAGDYSLTLAQGVYIFAAYRSACYIEKKAQGASVSFDGTEYGGFQLDPGMAIEVRIMQDETIVCHISSGGRLGWCQRAAQPETR